MRFDPIEIQREYDALVSKRKLKNFLCDALIYAGALITLTMTAYALLP
jgi:hypothetical protein